jgi:hypothetical protein
MSTSNVSSPAFALFGFGPVVADGLGLAYNIHDHQIRVNITSFEPDQVHTRYRHALEQSMLEMAEVLAAHPVSVVKNK